ncbi:putative phage abortive infection protein [uncultured Christiangramia sp.]|uniref:putative phage abortive infection protein n=1 Tax=Christiangramia sp. 3-2217-3z TaxID=3417564 RepID=UPI002609FEBF|nr:putative phage abortive infection protein [uncultured Christiangramia sp.]
MKLLPNNIEPDEYFGKNIQFLSLFLFLILFIIMVIFFGIFYRDFSIGELGAILSGTIGTMVALIIAVFTFLAFYVQYEANKKIQGQFNIQRTNEHFYKMLDIHLNNVDSFKMNSHRLIEEPSIIKIEELKGSYTLKNFSEAFNYIFVTVPSTNSQFDTQPIIINKEILKYNITCTSTEFRTSAVNDKRVFLLMIKDFHFCHSMIKNANEFFKYKIKIDSLNELSYKVFFWGSDSNHLSTSGVTAEQLENIVAYLTSIRRTFRNNKGAKLSFTYKTHEGEKLNTIRFVPLSGHVSRLAHYFRHLYQMVKFVHYSYVGNLISKLELENNLKVLRAQFTNEEVLLLYYNYRIGFGKNWDKLGEHDYPFFREYELLHNIPLYDNIPIDIQHPLNHFEKFIEEKRQINPKFKMFEWQRK